MILIGKTGSTSIDNSKKILNFKDRNRLKNSENINADYIIDNYRNWHGNYKNKEYQIPSNFVIYKEFIVSRKKIISIYKRKT